MKKTVLFLVLVLFLTPVTLFAQNYISHETEEQLFTLEAFASTPLSSVLEFSDNTSAVAVLTTSDCSVLQDTIVDVDVTVEEMNSIIRISPPVYKVAAAATLSKSGSKSDNWATAYLTIYYTKPTSTSYYWQSVSGSWDYLISVTPTSGKAKWWSGSYQNVAYSGWSLGSYGTSSLKPAAQSEFKYTEPGGVNLTLTLRVDV
jgi:hypothetical protein